MPDNYTVTTWTQPETEGDQYNTGAIITSLDDVNNTPTGSITQPMLAISPVWGGDQMWTVSVENFSISGGTSSGSYMSQFSEAFIYTNGQNGVVLPDEVEYVTMQNTVGINNLDNVVLVKIFLFPEWEMPNADWTINIDIDGWATVYSPNTNTYKWGVALTNGIWPGGNDQTAFNNNDIVNNNGMPLINSTGDFYLANYNQQTADAWNNHEAQRKQNPNAIPNCIIQQINSPIQVPVDDVLDNNGVGHTWFSNEEDIPCNVQFRIKPVSPAWKISIEDFSIMTSGVFRMRIGEAPYEEGFAYFSEGEPNVLGSPSLSSFDFSNTYWTPLYQPGSYPWGLNTLTNIDSNTVEACSGVGEPFSQPPNSCSTFPFDQEYWTDVVLPSEYENAWFGTGVPVTDWTSSFFGEPISAFGADPYIGSNWNDQWPALTGWLSQDDVNTLVGEVGWNCGSGWDTTTGLINSGGIVKHYMEPFIFRLTSVGNFAQMTGASVGAIETGIFGELTQQGNIDYQSNIDNLDLTNYQNPYSPIRSKASTWDDDGTYFTENGLVIQSAHSGSGGDAGPNTYRSIARMGSGAAGFRWIRTILMEETNPGENDNNIIVTIIPKPQEWEAGNAGAGSPIPWIDLVGNSEFHMLQLNGRATPAAQGAPPPINAGFNLISDSNSGNITVTRTSNSNISEDVENLLQPNQKNTYSFSARIPNNELTNLATIKVEAEEGYYLAETPYLSIDDTSPNLNFDINQNIQLKLSESTSNTSYTFDLLYKNNESISALEDISININFRSLVTQTRALEIRNITFGNQTVGAGGESRNITIYGKPGTPFELLVNSVDENLDSDDRVVDSTEESIINSRVSNSEVLISTGETLNQLSEKIQSTGKYSFNQTIPNTTIRSTAINGSMAASGATKIIFDDLTYVRVGDQVVMKEITSGFITVTELNPDGDNENECSVSASITAADNALVSFKRSRKYRIHIKPGTDASISTTGAMSSWSSDTDGWSGYYNKDINQYLNPVLTLRASTSESAGVITMNGATWNTNVPYDLTYIGRPNAIQNTIEGKTGVPTTKFTLTYLLDLVSGARNFAYVDTVDPAPAFSSNVEFINTTETPQVDWTNTTPELNGGTRINIDNIAITAAGANTITITANVELVEWGSSNVIMDLNLDNIVSNS